MSTHSYIAYVKSDNDIRCIYCHFDSYLEHVGNLLQKCYNESNLDELMDRGDLVSLELEPKACEAFKDRGESGVDAKHFNSLDELKKYADNDFNYYFKDGTWYYWNWNYIDDIKELKPEVDILKKTW